MKLLKQVTYITYVLAKPSNLSKSAHRPSDVNIRADLVGKFLALKNRRGER